MTRFIAVVAAALALSLGGHGAIAAPADPLLPNLKAFPATDVRLAQSGGKTFLRFSTLSGNITTSDGPTRGPMELRAGEILRRSGRQRVYQRVYLEGGGYQDRLVGEFVYHRGHRHFHFENYARYELQPVNAPGASERIGTKTSFCIMDTTAIDTNLPGAPEAAFYTSCSNSFQGMSFGWGDKYGYQLAGQEIDVTGLPDGTYRLRIIIDPLGRLQEATPADNTSEIQIALSSGTVSVLQ